MDHIILGMSFEECNLLKKETLNRARTKIDAISSFRDKLDYTRSTSLNRNSSWAAQLARYLDVDFENRAVNGSGLDDQYLRIRSDIREGKITNCDLVLVGLTTMNRMPDFRPNRPMPHCNTLISQFIPDDKGSRLLLELYDDHVMVLQYFKTLKLLDELNSRITLLMQPMGVWPLKKWLDILEGIDQAGVIRSYANEIWLECEHSILSELFLDRTMPLCEFGHPSSKAHYKLAAELAEILADRFEFKK